MAKPPDQSEYLATPRWIARAWVAAYVVLTLAPLALVAALRPSAGHGFWSEWAKALALIGIAVLALQFPLAARLRWLSHPFGLDLVMRFHRAMAMVAFGLILAHPLLLGVERTGLWTEWQQPWPIQLGRVTLAALLLLVAVSLLRRTMRLKFEWWRIGHDLLVIAVLTLAFVHSAWAGGDLQNPVARVVWIAVALPPLGLFIWHRLIRPCRLRRRPWTVESVQQQTPGVWDVSLVRPQGDDTADYLPGQFHFITLHRGRDLPEEEHHWTISSSPTEGNRLVSTIKESGDFTATIGQTRPGDKATVHGPFGRFSHALHPEDGELVFVAAGIGITPLRSMLRHMHDRQDQRNVLLLYGNRTQHDILFRDELEQIARGDRPRLRVVHVLSRPDDDWSGERGHVGIDTIERHGDGELKDKRFWVCGPEPMRRSIIHGLRQRGVPARRIHAEAFNLADGQTPRDGRGVRMRWLIVMLVMIWLLASVGAASLRRGDSSDGSHQHEHNHARETSTVSSTGERS